MSAFLGNPVPTSCSVQAEGKGHALLSGAPCEPRAGLSQPLLWEAAYRDVRWGIYAGEAEGT